MHIQLPPFGTLIPGQGGRFAAVMSGPLVGGARPTLRALLLANVPHQRHQWATSFKEIKNAASRVDGINNTAAMRKAESPAALWVTGLEVDGHRDLFIPALGELNAAAANIPEHFDPEGVVWTSTQASRYCAFVQGFALGNSDWYAKDDEWLVSPFRQIPLELLIA